MQSVENTEGNKWAGEFANDVFMFRLLKWEMEEKQEL